MNYGEKHYCDKSNCHHPKNLHCNQFCISCNRTIGPHRTSELKSEFVQVTQKELALQERLPPRLTLNLTHGCPVDCGVRQTIIGRHLPVLGRLLHRRRMIVSLCWDITSILWLNIPESRVAVGGSYLGLWYLVR